MTKLYNDITPTFYLSFVFVSIMFPLSWLFISEKIKELFIFMKTNKDLIHTVRTILQLFPEGVIIRSIDPITKQTVNRFANDMAWKIILNDVGEEQAGIVKINIIQSEENLQNHHVKRLASLDEFLEQQEFKIMEQADFKQYIKAMIEINKDSRNREVRFEKDDETFEESSNYFNVKSIRVLWENNKESFMHAFINTTQIRKLEEERAKSKWHHLMLASVSHEFRTPINAFVNSLSLIDYLLKEMIVNILPCKSCEKIVEIFNPKFLKFIKIGEVSTKLLLVLVEDILDLAKFDGNTFKLNISKFKIREIINEIDYIFRFQWIEKKINLSIEWKQELGEMELYSDSKRIKQVLINLISNSFKFTEIGKIDIIKINKY